jgi:hypothetical protein
LLLDLLQSLGLDLLTRPVVVWLGTCFIHAGLHCGELLSSPDVPNVSDHIDYGLVVRAFFRLLEIIQHLPLALEISTAHLQELSLLGLRPTMNFCDQPCERAFSLSMLVEEAALFQRRLSKALTSLS